jgi:hypothetical protein
MQVIGNLKTTIGYQYGSSQNDNWASDHQFYYQDQMAEENQVDLQNCQFFQDSFESANDPIAEEFGYVESSINIHF